MNPKKLEKFVRNIRNSYGKNMVSEEVMDFITEKIHHIPEKAWNWITDEILRTHDKCPEKLHSAILSAFYEWRQQNPQDGEEPGERRACVNEHCYEGMAIYWRWEELYQAYCTVAVNCGDCKKSGNSVARRLTAYEAIQKGWEPDSVEARKKYQEHNAERRV